MNKNDLEVAKFKWDVYQSIFLYLILFGLIFELAIKLHLEFVSWLCLCIIAVFIAAFIIILFIPSKYIKKIKKEEFNFIMGLIK